MTYSIKRYEPRGCAPWFYVVDESGKRVSGPFSWIKDAESAAANLRKQA